MGVLQRFEHRLEGMVEGAFARAFKSELQPVEVASAIQREMDDRAAIVAQGRTLVPNDFVVEVAEDDYARLDVYADNLGIELATLAREYAKEQGYSFVGPVRMRFEGVRDLTTGTFRILSGVIRGTTVEDGEIRRPVIEIPRGCHREGTNWIIPQLLALRRTWRPDAIAIPRNGPAAGLIDTAENAGIEVLKMSSADEAAAFAYLVTTVRKPPEDGRLIHLGRDLAPGLWSSVASAETRDVGDGGRAWSRRDSASDITPVSAGTNALWALNHKRRNYNPAASVR